MTGATKGGASPLVDLHLHTTASDGRLTATQLIELVARTTLRVVAITDHDTTAAVTEALEAARRFPRLRVIPGVEISTWSRGSEVHLLGYHIDCENPRLNAALARSRDSRVDAARRTVAKLAALGIEVSWERVRTLANGTVGRPHIARAMMERGYVDSVQEAFDRYLAEGRPARVERERMSVVEGIALVHGAGGAAVIAHPRTVDNLNAVLPEAVAAGLDGIEVYAEKYGSADRARFRKLAARHRLVPCGGTDYHAFGNEGELQPGAADIPSPPVTAPDELLARALARRGVCARRDSAPRST